MLHYTVLFFCLFTSIAKSETVVLIHGYLGSSKSWLTSDVVGILRDSDYSYAGNYSYSKNVINFRQGIDNASAKTIYTVDLPSLAPIKLQVDWLRAYIEDISNKQPQQQITLVGHSAGGLVARLLLITNMQKSISKLVTIATPHLGTSRASQALNATDTSGMFGWAKSLVTRQQTGDTLYNTLQSSKGVLIDLNPPSPGNMLYWLNQQAHPKIEYISVVRELDNIVPPDSQNMEHVFALAGRTHAYLSPAGHEITAKDGILLQHLLSTAHTVNQ